MVKTVLSYYRKSVGFLFLCCLDAKDGVEWLKISSGADEIPSSNRKKEKVLSLETLLSKPPREKSGTSTGNRYAYQHSWALRLLLDLHEKPGDYCVLFDVHDDVVSLNHSSSPDKAEFYQVKTKDSGNWTIGSLTRQKKNKDKKTLPSIFGKLYHNWIQFSPFAQKMAIVSNASFSVTTSDLPAGINRSSICVLDLSADDQKKLSEHLKVEIGPDVDLTGLDLAYLETTSLSIVDHEIHTEGYVSLFLSRVGDGTIPPNAFHKTLRSEIQRRNNREEAYCNFAELQDLKGITRQRLQSMIDSVASKDRQDDLVNSIRQQLSTEHVGFKELHSWIENIRIHLANRHDHSNLIVNDAIRRTEKELLALASVMSSSTPLTSTVDSLLCLDTSEWRKTKETFGENYLKAIFIVAIYEHQLPSANS